MNNDWVALAHVRSALLSGARAHYEAEQLLEIRVPTIVDVTGACETVSNVIAVDTESGAVLTQTGQLALEYALEHADGVWCHTGSFRREVVDARHLQEFELVEEEVSHRHPAVSDRSAGGDPHAMFEILLDRIALAVKAMIAQAVTGAEADLAHLGGDPDALAATLAQDFARISYRDALAALGKDPIADWGHDFTREDEEHLLHELAGGRQARPAFVTSFPEHLKFFNMKTDPRDTATVLSADLLLPGIGEAAGAAVREDDSALLIERFERLMLPRLLERDGMTHRTATEPFEPYFAIIAAGSAPSHAGYGLGLERVLSYITRQPDIRRVSMPWLLTAHSIAEEAR